jgi:hypothetical protein
MRMRGIAGAIWWKLNSAFLLNQRDAATVLLGMLEDEGSKKPLDQSLGVHYQRFLALRDAVRDGTFAKPHGIGSQAPPLDPFAHKERSGEEAAFHRILMSPAGRGPLFACLGAGSKATMVHELEMGIYGRCDFVVREGRTWHAVEVKASEAKHDIVGQIDKYFLALELDMCLGMHDFVKAAVVARSFPPYVAGELSRMGVVMIAHDGSPESLRKL